MDISARPRRLTSRATDRRQRLRGRLARLDEWLYQKTQASRRYGLRYGMVAWRLAVAVVTTGLVWPALAATALVIASAAHWLVVPLIQTTSPWALPIDLGWGQSVYLSYGLLAAALAVASLAFPLFALRRLDWRAIAQGAAPTQRLAPRTLALLALAALLAPLLLLFQALFVDMRLMAGLAAQENDSLLIALHLGYKLQAQHFKMTPFAITIATPLDRLTLLAQLVGTGAVAALLAWLPCLYGAYRAWDDQRQATVGANLDGEDEDDEDMPIGASIRPASAERARWRLVALIVVVVGVALLGRAPAGVFCEYLGTVSIESGDYTGALNWLGAAQTLDPSLADLPAFHQQRGEALYEQGARSGLDVGLYLAAQYRTLGAIGQAWQQDQALFQRYPQTPVVKQDTALTLEAEAELNTRVPFTYDTNTEPQPLRQDGLHPITNANSTIAAVDQALPWLTRLLALEPDNLYGHYLRGRISLTAHAYDAGASDFQRIIDLSHDKDMQSAAYTYLAFCRAGQGDLVGERALLYHAVELDHGYYNNTAREALSGLH